MSPVPPTRRLAGKRVLLAIFVILVATVVPAILVPALACRPPVRSFEDYGLVPAFALTDQLGARFSQAELAGHVSIVDFVFTRCDTICPASSMKMAHLQEVTATAAERIKLVSFSVDPTYDTPERLAAYGARFGADPDRWRFLTGPAEAMRVLLEGPFMTTMTNNGVRATGAPDIAHGKHFILLDDRLHIRGLYDSSDPVRLEQLATDARYLARRIK